MIKVGAWHYTDFCNIGNNLFKNKEAGIGDEALLGTVELAKQAKIENIQIEIINFNKLHDYDIFLCFDIFWKNKSLFKKLTGRHLKAYEALKQFRGQRYLILHECATVHGQNWNTENHILFDKIFTWSDIHIDNKKYYKLNCTPRKTKQYSEHVLSSPKKFASMICSNIVNSRTHELYTVRKTIIEYASENFARSFDLYGKGWDQYVFDRRYKSGRLLNKMTPKLKTIGIKNNKYSRVYRGALQNKEIGIRDYKFHFCLENSQNYPGYVTEKIFDAMRYGSIPVYLGASNINDLIPEDCFIDINEFKSIDQLFQFISKMGDAQRYCYLSNIDSFLNSEKYYPFSMEYYVSTLINHLGGKNG